MHSENVTPWRHTHRFETGHEEAAERRTKIVVALTVATMIVEIAAGTMFNSMALLADGWHMSTHAGALGIAVAAYIFARRHADDARFTFGTAKVGSLAAFASATSLAFVAVMLAWQSAERLMQSPPIAFDEAIAVATAGLAVNLLSAWILGHGQGHADARHDHTHGPLQGAHNHVHHDHNLRGAYLHVVADALTSVLAIAALLFGKYFGWTWMDPLMGIVGAVLIARWSIGLMRQTAAVLLDCSDHRNLDGQIRHIIEAEADNRISDLHVWEVGPRHYAAIISVVTANPMSPAYYKRLLRSVESLSHVTIEVLRCAETPA